ncbi:DUF2188 domain-containing protein [Paeniglutamicibacter kerguelensis]|uniref:DUF2188 domain-containing protein n=1 Tax=Paeniglutamicibacter kerguelensis TaxID=254788 RepID=A0ABS4XCZ6_9MICC|nr:DUF2188 domain-containing protein [Paeniglutamicibacter kerguelensis]MBP2386344.1 hypothetical protein [Paeniglutamicibacter kerguelensis]
MADYSVTKKNDGDWQAKRDGASKASSVHSTQADAARAAKGYSANNGGGEVRISGTSGKIRAKDTVKPGNDPRHIKG